MQEAASYGTLTLSTVMFGLTFFFSDIFRKSYGSGLQATLVMNLGGGLFGLATLVAINGLKLEFTVYALIIAILSAVNALLFSFCSLKALGKINLSLYSLFSMLGGMTLPFLCGILFFGEVVTLGKTVCFVVISFALCLTVKKGEGNNGTLFYIGIFVFNGMSGVISKVYQALPFEKITSAGFSILSAIITVGISFVLLLLIKREKIRIEPACIFAMAGHGILSRVANWLLLVALLSLPASAQYPFVTGGTMIVSTVISLFSRDKPDKKEIATVILAFAGIIMLVLLPEKELLSLTLQI